MLRLYCLWLYAASYRPRRSQPHICCHEGSSHPCPQYTLAAHDKKRYACSRRHTCLVVSSDVSIVDASAPVAHTHADSAACDQQWRKFEDVFQAPCADDWLLPEKCDVRRPPGEWAQWKSGVVPDSSPLSTNETQKSLNVLPADLHTPRLVHNAAETSNAPPEATLFSQSAYKRAMASRSATASRQRNTTLRRPLVHVRPTRRPGAKIRGQQELDKKWSRATAAQGSSRRGSTHLHDEDSSVRVSEHEEAEAWSVIELWGQVIKVLMHAMPASHFLPRCGLIPLVFSQA
jgi:hypothetical protein